MCVFVYVLIHGNVYRHTDNIHYVCMHTSAFQCVSAYARLLYPCAFFCPCINHAYCMYTVCVCACSSKLRATNRARPRARQGPDRGQIDQ